MDWWKEGAMDEEHTDSGKRSLGSDDERGDVKASSKKSKRAPAPNSSSSGTHPASSADDFYFHISNPSNLSVPCAIFISSFSFKAVVVV